MYSTIKPGDNIKALNVSCLATKDSNRRQLVTSLYVCFHPKIAHTKILIFSYNAEFQLDILNHTVCKATHCL